MRKDKLKAYELRRKNKSYSEIRKALGIAKSTLAGWFKEEEWSQGIRDKLAVEHSLSSPKKLAAIQKANKARWSRVYQEYRAAAEAEFAERKDHPLFIAGVMLYWSQGNTSPKDSSVRLASNDPQLIRVFHAFLTRELKVSQKISAHLVLYPDLNDAMQKTFWSRAAGIALSSFTKSAVIKGKPAVRRLSYGVCHVSVSSRELKEKVLAWVNLYQKLLA